MIKGASFIIMIINEVECLLLKTCVEKMRCSFTCVAHFAENNTRLDLQYCEAFYNISKYVVERDFENVEQEMWNN